MSSLDLALGGLAVAQQSEGHPDVVVRAAPGGKAVCKLPNGTVVKVLQLAEAPDVGTVAGIQFDKATKTAAEVEPGFEAVSHGWVKRSNLKPWEPEAFDLNITSDGKAMAEAVAKICNPFCPLSFPFEDPITYKQVFGTRHHTTGEGWSGGSNGPVEKKGHKYDDTVGNMAALYVSLNGEAPIAMTEQADQVAYVKSLSQLSAIKIGGWGSGMKDRDYFESLRQICSTAVSFYDEHQEETFSMKDQKMSEDYIQALASAVRPFVDGVLANQPEHNKFVVHWDGDDFWNPWDKTFDTYSPLAWAVAAVLHEHGRLAALLCVKNSRTKWTKAIGSEADDSREEQWYREERQGADRTPRQVFATSYFENSKIKEMLAFINAQGKRGTAPDFACLVHSTEKNRFASDRQDTSSYGYFGASVQCAMAQGADATSTVVMLGGGDVIYNEMTNKKWTGAALSDEVTKGYKPGTKVVVLDVWRKNQSQRCKVFEDSGEPVEIFGSLRGRIIEIISTFVKGQLVEVFSMSKAAWVEGQIEDILDEPRPDSPHLVGSVYVTYDRTESSATSKWVAPEHISSVLRHKAVPSSVPTRSAMPSGY